MDKKTVATLITLGGLIAGAIGFAAKYETTTAHDKDISVTKETVQKDIENAVLRIENKIDKMEAYHHGHGR